MRKWFLGIVIIVIFGSVPFAAADFEAVRSGYGSLTIGAVFQAGFTYYVGTDRLDTETNKVYDLGYNNAFYIGYARLAFKGIIVDDRVRYMFQVDLNPRDEYVQAAGPMLLDAKLGFKYIPYTTIWVGRFAPDFTYFNPLNVAQLELIDYPLMNQLLCVQRQTGLVVAVNHKYFEFNLGATNGLHFNKFTEYLNPEDRNDEGLGNTDWGDENTYKDIFASLAVKPVQGLRMWGGFWWGNPLDYFKKKNDGENLPHEVPVYLFDAGLGYRASFGLLLMGEFFYSKMKFDNKKSTPGLDEHRAERDLFLYSMSYFVRAGFNFKETLGFPIEIIGQYDWLDPDLRNSNYRGKKDELTYVTAGVNYYIKDLYAMVYVNYVYKEEDWRVLKKNESGKKTGIDNDEFKIQFQISF